MINHKILSFTFIGEMTQSAFLCSHFFHPSLQTSFVMVRVLRPVLRSARRPARSISISLETLWDCIIYIKGRLSSAPKVNPAKSQKLCEPLRCWHHTHWDPGRPAATLSVPRYVKCDYHPGDSTALCANALILTLVNIVATPFCHFQLISCIFMCQLCKSQDKNALSTHDLDWLSLLHGIMKLLHDVQFTSTLALNCQ